MPTVIYEPRGRAREYSPLAVNLYRGCSHGCNIKEDLWRVAELTATHARYRSERADLRLLCPALA